MSALDIDHGQRDKRDKGPEAAAVGVEVAEGMEVANEERAALTTVIPGWSLPSFVDGNGNSLPYVDPEIMAALENCRDSWGELPWY